MKQVAVILGVSYKYARALVQSGKLTAVNIGLKSEKVWRVSDEALEKFFQANKNNINKGE